MRRPRARALTGGKAHLSMFPIKSSTERYMTNPIKKRTMPINPITTITPKKFGRRICNTDDISLTNMFGCRFSKAVNFVQYPPAEKRPVLELACYHVLSPGTVLYPHLQNWARRPKASAVSGVCSQGSMFFFRMRSGLCSSFSPVRFHHTHTDTTHTH